MYQGKSILAVVGARSGSKGLPDKNIAPCAGRPLMAWSILAGLGSRYVDRVVLSTDSERYARIGREAGADVPCLRPEEISRDNSSLGQLLAHMLEWCSLEEGKEYDYVMFLPPTSPLRSSAHIDQAIEQLFEKAQSPNETLVSVYEAPAHLGWLMRPNQDGYIEFCFDVLKKNPRRQELPRYFLPNGAIKICPVSVLSNDFYGERTQYYIMSQEESVDIDDLEDLRAAERMLLRQDASQMSPTRA